MKVQIKNSLYPGVTHNVQKITSVSINSETSVKLYLPHEKMMS